MQITDQVWSVVKEKSQLYVEPDVINSKLTTFPDEMSDIDQRFFAALMAIVAKGFFVVGLTPLLEVLKV